MFLVQSGTSTVLYTGDFNTTPDRYVDCQLFGPILDLSIMQVPQMHKG